TITTLDDVERQLTTDDLVIADAERAVAIAGIMGSQVAEVTEQTQRVFLESALFDYKSVRRSSRRLGLRTDASSRFDKGVDPARVIMALERAAQLFKQLNCGAPESIAVGQVPDVPVQQVISLRPERVEQLLGMAIGHDEMQRLLERLGLKVDSSSLPWQVVAPSRRSDLQIEVDIIEEVARLYGLDKLPVGKMSGPLMRGALTPYQQAEQNLRHQLLGSGLSEILTLSFINPKEVIQVVGVEHPWNEGLLLKNPLSTERSLMRPSLLFGLLQVLKYNAARQQQDLAIFEIANVFRPRPGAPLGQPDEPLHLGMACMGQMPHNWHSAAIEYDFFYLKGVLVNLLAKQGVRNLEWRRAEEKFLHPGRSAAIYWNGSYLGYLGELHPDVAELYDLKQRAMVAEITLAPVLKQAGEIPLFQGIPRYPAVVRDLAVVVDRQVTAAQVAQVIKEAAGDLLVDLELFDVYQGEQVADQQKSLAYTLVLQSRERTLLDAEVAELQERVIKELSNQLGAKLR
ncbi:MAG TPA: phenylalanine--tRNA ligase subunit beta, partial [Firmicutes bacterium]|nr:phenylalanine--tRNA ligase subunit beta [Bacillota bacterium]